MGKILIPRRHPGLHGPIATPVGGGKAIHTPGFQLGPNGALSSQVYAEDGFGTGNVELSTHSLDTDVASSGWTNVLPGTDLMQTSGGKLYIFDQGNGAISTYVNDQGKANGILSADITVNSGTANVDDYIGLVARYADTNNFLRAYYVYTAGNHKIVLDKYVLGAWENVQVNNVTVTLGATYELRIEMDGSDVKVYWDDNLEISYTDNDLNTNTKMGVHMNPTLPHQDNSMDNYKFRSL